MLVQHIVKCTTGDQHGKETTTYGCILDFLTVTVKVCKINETTATASFTANGVLTKLYKRQPRDNKSRLPVVMDNEMQPTYRWMNMSEIVAAVNFVSIQDISGKISDKGKWVVVVSKSMA